MFCMGLPKSDTYHFNMSWCAMLRVKSQIRASSYVTRANLWCCVMSGSADVKVNHYLRTAFPRKRSNLFTLLTCTHNVTFIFSLDLTFSPSLLMRRSPLREHVQYRYIRQLLTLTANKTLIILAE